MEQTEECVVYKITNNKNGRIYIGVSTCFIKRMRGHKSKPSKGMLEDRLNYSWNDYTKEIIYQGTEDWCYNKEIELIKELKPEYNISPGGYGGGSGEDSPNALLSDIEAYEIRHLYKYVDGYTQKYIGSLYNVDGSIIGCITRGESYRSAGGPLIIYKLGYNSLSIPEIDVLDIRFLAFSYSIPNNELGKEYGMSTKRIRNITTGSTYFYIGGPMKPILGNSGQNSPEAKITEENVLEIRRRGSKKETYSSISKDFPINGKQVSRICRNERWKETGGPIAGINYPFHITNSLFDENTIIEIRERCVNTSDTYQEIAMDYNVHKGTIGSIARGDRYSEYGGPIVIGRPIKNLKHGAKLTQTNALEIKMRGYLTKDTYKKIAEDYPVGPDACSCIIRGKTWQETAAPSLGKDYKKRGEGNE